MDKNVTMKLFGTAMAVVAALISIIWTMTVNGQEKGDTRLQAQIDYANGRIDTQYSSIMSQLIEINRSLGSQTNRIK
jgi:hypothetical protein